MDTPSSRQIEQQLKQASAAFRAGNIVAAEETVDALLLRHPDRADVQLAKGVLLISKGDQRAGLAALLLALEILPTDCEALAWAALAALNLQEFEQAESISRRFVAEAPTHPRPYFLLANALRGQNRQEEALHEIDRCLQLRPDDGEALVTKARLLREWDLPGLAVDFYQKAMAIRPTPTAAIDLARILLNESHPREALDLLEKVLAMIPVQSRPYDLLGQAHTQLFQFEEAEKQWVKGEAYSQNPVALIHSRARAEITVGRFEIAEELLARVLSDSATADEAFAILVTARQLHADDEPLLSRMEKVAMSRELPEPRLAALNYALGKAYDDLKAYDRAIGYFDEANRICLQMYPRRRNFQPIALKRFIDFQIETFTEGAISEWADFGLEDVTPLFVVGMMRSGTTLTESILGAHSKILSGGEQSFWLDRVNELVRWTDDSLEFKHGQALTFAADYLKLIAPSVPGIRHVVDKNPSNFDVAAMLHCLFPNSKIVHLRRQAVDNLLSIWMTPVSGNVGYASDKQNLMFAYREHMRLAKHLREVLPLDRFQSLSYEDLTSHPVEAITKLLGFVEVPVEQSCFEPEKSLRSVLTPSVSQVRQPIYQASQVRWKRYEPWLGDFAELLDEESWAN